jgi:hypothetical protein
MHRSVLLRHVKKFCALWLVAQVLLPFTAPFPTCDLSDLLGRGHHHAPVAPPNSHVDGDYAFAPPLATTAGRLKLVVVSALDVSNVAGMTPAILSGRPLVVAAAGLEHRQNQATVLRL